MACPSNGWSMVSSAPTNSQLAGVLAGFVFTGIIILLGRPGPRNTQTLALFCATFVALAFDSYLFSMVSGGDTGLFCTRVWSQGMAASGLLAVGGVALIGGIAWLLNDHLDDTHSASRSAADNLRVGRVDLDRLSRFMLYGVACAVTLILAATTSDYLSVVSNSKLGQLVWLTLSSPAAVGGISFALSTVRRHRRSDKNCTATEVQTSTKVLSVATLAILAYSVIGPVYAGGLASVPEIWFRSSSTAIVITTIVVGLIVPSALIIALILAVPPWEVAEHIAESRSR